MVEIPTKKDEKNNTHPLYIGLFQKKKKTGGEYGYGYEDMEFPGVSKK